MSNLVLDLRLKLVPVSIVTFTTGLLKSLCIEDSKPSSTLGKSLSGRVLDVTDRSTHDLFQPNNILIIFKFLYLILETTTSLVRMLLQKLVSIVVFPCGPITNLTKEALWLCVTPWVNTSKMVIVMLLSISIFFGQAYLRETLPETSKFESIL